MLMSDVFGPPTCPGVYAVVVRNHEMGSAEHVIYVGSSSHIRSRVSSPDHPYRIAYERFTPNALVTLKFLVCDNYKEVERDVIKGLRPLLNKHHNG